MRITRPQLAKFCELLRRGGFPEKSVKLLFRYVRGKGRNLKRANAEELIEYAGALIALKATEEAKSLLQDESLRKRPKSYLFLAFAEINEWNYEKARDHLIKYLDLAPHASYERMIVMVNLLASKVFLLPEGMQDPELGNEISKNIKFCEDNNYLTLKANLKEINTQFLLKTHSQNKAQESTKLISSIIDDPMAKDNLFIQKWSIIADTPQKGAKAEVIKKWELRLLALKELAEKIQHYETIREVDFYLSYFAPALIEKVYFGTPYESYRRRITKEHKPALPDFYWYSLSQEVSYKFDYLTFNDFKLGSLPMRVILALVQDFYRPLNKYAFFTIVFQGEHFNPDSSFNKLHQAIFRARTWLKEKEIPLTIQEKNESFFLSGPVAIKVYLQDKQNHVVLTDQNQIIWDEIQVHFSDQPFSVKEILSLGLFNNPRAAQRFLETKIRENLIEKSGKARSIQYRILSKSFNL